MEKLLGFLILCIVTVTVIVHPPPVPHVWFVVANIEASEEEVENAMKNITTTDDASLVKIQSENMDNERELLRCIRDKVSRLKLAYEKDQVDPALVQKFRAKYKQIWKISLSPVKNATHEIGDVKTDGCSQELKEEDCKKKSETVSNWNENENAACSSESCMCWESSCIVSDAPIVDNSSDEELLETENEEGEQNFGSRKFDYASLINALTSVRVMKDQSWHEPSIFLASEVDRQRKLSNLSGCFNNAFNTSHFNANDTATSKCFLMLFRQSISKTIKVLDIFPSNWSSLVRQCCRGHGEGTSNGKENGMQGSSGGQSTGGDSGGNFGQSSSGGDACGGSGGDDPNNHQNRRSFDEGDGSGDDDEDDEEEKKRRDARSRLEHMEEENPTNQLGAEGGPGPPGQGEVQHLDQYDGVTSSQSKQERLMGDWWAFDGIFSQHKDLHEAQNVSNDISENLPGTSTLRGQVGGKSHITPRLPGSPLPFPEHGLISGQKSFEDRRSDTRSEHDDDQGNSNPETNERRNRTCLARTSELERVETPPSSIEDEEALSDVQQRIPGDVTNISLPDVRQQRCLPEDDWNGASFNYHQQHERRNRTCLARTPELERVETPPSSIEDEEAHSVVQQRIPGDVTNISLPGVRQQRCLPEDDMNGASFNYHQQHEERDRTCLLRTHELERVDAQRMDTEEHSNVEGIIPGDVTNNSRSDVRHRRCLPGDERSGAHLDRQQQNLQRIQQQNFTAVQPTLQDEATWRRSDGNRSCVGCANRFSHFDGEIHVGTQEFSCRCCSQTHSFNMMLHSVDAHQRSFSDHVSNDRQGHRQNRTFNDPIPPPSRITIECQRDTCEETVITIPARLVRCPDCGRLFCSTFCREQHCCMRRTFHE